MPNTRASPGKPVIHLLVSDLDNTLYDWLDSFVPAFYAMVHVASELLAVPGERLLDDLKALHQQWGSAERPFTLADTPAVVERYPAMSRAERIRRLDPAFRAFNHERKHRLRLYEGVLSTVQYVRRNGVPFVAHTEAPAATSLFRLHALGLWGYVDRLYAPAQGVEAHPDPKRQEFYRSLAVGKVRLVEAGHRKPDAAILRGICADLGVDPRESLYVGDSLTRDVGVAQEAGMQTAWARYGCNRDSGLWQKLVRVTHWSAADVARDAELSQRSSSVRPDQELARFSDLLLHYEFCGKGGTEAPDGTDQHGVS